MAGRDGRLEFPDGPRSDLDRALSQLVESAHGVQATQGRLRSLLRASQVIAEQLDLPTVLRTIIEATVELVGARYGAIGVIAPDGSLEQFIHVGMPPDLVARIGHLPEGHGLLGALIEEQEPIRLEHLTNDPRSSGFPREHPPMDSFLGVPVRVGGEIYGNLYLAEQSTGAFSSEDQELVVALAATAGAAIDHARLFDETRRRQQWAAASAEVIATLLSDQAEESLSVIADRVAALADADLVCIVLPISPSAMIVEVARGEQAGRYPGRVFEARGTLAGRALEGRQPILSDIEADASIDPEQSFGPTMAVPLTSSDDPMGVLVVSRVPGRARFTVADLEMTADFAAQASIALRLAAARADSQRLAMLDDRGRIARDLHDHVIQRLFGAGLGLQAIAGSTSDPVARGRIAEQVDVLDAAIAEIRTAIFTMTARPDADRPSLRHRVIDLLGETAGLFAESPRLSFAGPVDLMVPAGMVDDVVAVVREGLANVAKHADAEHVSIVVSLAAGSVAVEIRDDGVGIDATSDRSSGLSNLGDRAAAWGGSFSAAAGQSGGTVLSWSAPVSASGTPA